MLSLSPLRPNSCKAGPALPGTLHLEDTGSATTRNKVKMLRRCSTHDTWEVISLSCSSISRRRLHVIKRVVYPQWTSHRVVNQRSHSAIGRYLAAAVVRDRRGSAKVQIRGIFGGALVKKDDPPPPAKPIDFDVASKIEGLETQIVVVDLEPGQVLRAETGSLIYMTDGVEIHTSLGGGISAGFKRMLTGENMFISDFRYTGAGSHGTVALGTEYPSKIVRVSLADFGGSLVCQKGAFLGGTHDLQIEMEYAKKLSVGFFGGQGFILQRLVNGPSGDSDAFIKAGGVLVRKDLQPGETLRVTSGSLVAFEPTVQYDIEMLKGVKNIVFGGEGLFLAHLTGPGIVYLQSMPFDRLVGAIASRVPRGGGMGLALGGAGAGSEGAEDEASGEEGGQDFTSSSSSAAGAATAGSGAFGTADETGQDRAGPSGAEIGSQASGAGAGGSEEVWTEGGEEEVGSPEGGNLGGDEEGSGVADWIRSAWDIFTGRSDD